MKRLAFLPLLSLMSHLAAAPENTSGRDPVPDLLKSAFQKYTKHDLSGASADLAQAQKIIDERRGAFGLKQLPNIQGWTADKPERQEGALFGTGTALKRTYKKGADEIEAMILMDSPLVQQLAPLLANPQIAQGAGFEAKKVDGHDALVKAGKDKSELNIWLGEGMLFKLTGSGGISESQLTSFARQFDFKALLLLKKEMK